MAHKKNINNTITPGFNAGALDAANCSGRGNGRDTAGLIKITLNDHHNTVIYCESEAEAARVTPVYRQHLANLGTASGDRFNKSL